MAILDQSIPLKALNSQRWIACKITPARQAEVTKVAERLSAADAKMRYQAISQAVWGTPERWYFVAVVHEREASQNWNSQLGQGDPLNKISQHIPRGRGPFLTRVSDVPGNDAFHRGALDALENCPPYAGRWTDWTIGGVLTLWTDYNGTGYETFHHEPSPYDWGATNIEEWGKYIADGKWAAHVWDSQIGCAALLKGMMAGDASIHVEGA